MRKSVIMATPQVNLTLKSTLLVLCVSVKVNSRLEPYAVGGKYGALPWARYHGRRFISDV